MINSKHKAIMVVALLIASYLAHARWPTRKDCFFHDRSFAVVNISSACPLHPDDSRHQNARASEWTKSASLNRSSYPWVPGPDEEDPTNDDDHVDSSSCYHSIPVDDFN